MRSRLLLKAATAIAAATLTVGGVTACGSDSDSANLPAAAELLKQAAEGTAKIDTAHFAINVDGKDLPPGLNLRSLEGDLSKNGDAAGVVHIEFAGQTFEGDFVILAGKGYYKGVTGGWQAKSAAAMKLLYDSTIILDPERGISKMLSSTTEGKSVAAEKINGIETIKIEGQTPKAVVAKLVPGIDGDPVEVDYWVEKAAPHRMVRAVMKQPADATVTADVSKPNEPITVNAPL